MCPREPSTSGPTLASAAAGQPLSCSASMWRWRVGERTDELDLAHAVALEELAATGAAPAALRQEQLRHCPPPGGIGAFEDHIGRQNLALRDAPFELGARQADGVGVLQGTEPLWFCRQMCRVRHRRPFIFQMSCPKQAVAVGDPRGRTASSLEVVRVLNLFVPPGGSATLLPVPGGRLEGHWRLSYNPSCQSASYRAEARNSKVTNPDPFA